ncbi:piriformospora indica-insensitive protein 2-like [Trifolium pratense]|uniref:Piriformospora indica-insensitive protein 2-like n=1 Tax=Trifolium pratense TaxID=57577 RepID=A0A2K3LG05_TRIPR|nr:piriformospora indica-insensitive protein 2-like [Trifolium pratense]
MGLVGEIPASVGVYLKNLTYLGLDNNMLDGTVPEEFGILKFANEINLENNNLSGRITFSCEVGERFKLAGNVGLCLGKNYSCCSGNGGCSSLCQLNACQILTNDDADDDAFFMFLWFFFMLFLINRL